jgi:CelD/BcsL family acetyltransferase involved in cellulose biosynthesis
MGTCYIDDEPAAAQLWIVTGKVAAIYKICYAEKFEKSSVGSVLTARMMEHALDVDKVKEVDYLSGDDGYKANWMSDRRERWGIIAFNPRSVWGAAGY